MMRVFLLSILFCFFSSGKEEPSYYALSADEFFGLSEVNTPIELEQFDKKLLEAAVFYAANEVRRQKHKPLFEYDSILNKAARFHADYLKEEQLVDHFNKRDKKFRTPYDRVQVFSGDFTAVAENLARLPVYKLGNKGEFFIDAGGQLIDKERQPLQTFSYAELARQVVNGWMHSKGHRENMMGDFGLLGVGVSDISYNKNDIPELYLVQNFGNH